MELNQSCCADGIDRRCEQWKVPIDSYSTVLGPKIFTVDQMNCGISTRVYSVCGKPRSRW